MTSDNGLFQQRKFEKNKYPFYVAHSPFLLTYLIPIEILMCLPIICNRESTILHQVNIYQHYNQYTGY